MKLVIEQEDLYGPDAVLDALEGHSEFDEAFAEWWANNHSGAETIEFIKTLTIAYEAGAQDEPDKAIVRMWQN